MMILQCGQTGLYRRDSIMTDALSPDMLAGATLWVDGTDSSALLDSLGGAPVATDGADVVVMLNKINVANCFFVSPPRVEPSLELAAVNGRSTLSFVNTGAGISNTTSDGATALPASTLLTAANKLFVVAVKVTALPDAQTLWNNAGILSVSGWFGLHAYSTGADTCAALAFNYDQNGPQEVTVPFPKGEWVVLTLSHQANQLRLRLNGGAWSVTPCLASQDMTGALLLCEPASGGGSHGIEIAHLVAMNTSQTEEAINACGRWVATEVGIPVW